MLHIEKTLYEMPWEADFCNFFSKRRVRKMMPKIDDEIFKKLINHHRNEGLASNHIMIQALVDKIIELSERVARLEENE